MTKYSVFSYVGGHSGNEPPPVGIVTWSQDQVWYQAHFLHPAAHLTEMDSDDCLAYVSLIQDKLRHWEKAGKLPYSEKDIKPSEDAWWEHVRKLLVHKIRLSEPKDLPGRFSQDSVQTLFQSVVGRIPSLTEPLEDAGRASNKMPHSGPLLKAK